MLNRTKRQIKTELPSGRFIAAVTTIGSMQLMSTMDVTITIVALPKIQNQLNLSDSGRTWVFIAPLLTYSGLMLLGGRLGDTIGRKRAFMIGAALFTLSSAMCGFAWGGGALILARLLQGVALAILGPTCMALVATTFPKGPTRNAAMAVFGAMSVIGSVAGLAVGGILTDVSWRLVFLICVPIGLLALYLARTALGETDKERMKLDVSGALLATLFSTAAFYGLSLGPEKGWLSVTMIASAVVAVGAFTAFVVVERTAENPIVPFSLFFDRSRLATFGAMFLVSGVALTLTVLVAVYVQDIMGYSPLRAGISFIPFAIATGVGVGVSSQLVARLSPRVVVIIGCALVLGALLYGSTLNRGVPYFPNLALPIFIAGLGLGIINVPLGLSLIASVGPDRIGPTSAIALMVASLGGPIVLPFTQAAVMARTLHLGGTTGPVKFMNPAQLNALDHGYTYGMLWLSGVIALLAAVALLIGYTARQVAQAQEVQKALDAREL
ncbi:MFS transporter [Mycobacterium intermedium]|uniref:MFS transporter n=1 Tax=Mycobacterium intermedium TaxID=28445 RepID=A0A1E3SC89_MYCIE|nr:MFS transporter [Mycobacterium intermedium]MCV6962469.1 MFS transporter [Mycobacterium intermedium]ODQ99743.1 MFS transporter [Mycobacterium intermedium]OPE46196.1 MFS transporter [Mycobacterium intermedium]ORA95721.1 MFS transporter [Mycobacterium intermedium]